MPPLGTHPNATTPTELKAALLRYAAEYPDNWRDNVLEAGRATSWTPEKIDECLTEFCAWQFKIDNTRAKFTQYTADISLWLKRQPRFDKEHAPRNGGQAANGQTGKANINRLGSDPSVYNQPQKF